MQNFLSSGKSLGVVAPTGGVTAGQAIKVGSLVGVVHGSAAEGETAVVSLKGVYTLPKATGAAWVQGDTLYWDDTAKKFTKTSTSNTFAGYAAADAASGDATGNVLLSH